MIDVSKKEYKKIGIVYISESDQTYNPNWRTDIYDNKIKIENGLNTLFIKKGIKFVVDFWGEFRANNLCWNPTRIAFIEKSKKLPLTTYVVIPGSKLAEGDGYTCLGHSDYWDIVWFDCDRCEKFDNSYFPNQQCFRINCGKKHMLYQ
ncbi:MAG: hypothetical protein N2Z85_02575 [Patescibacteria group bacterium]|nr:hypothetical protein [Patescibacteria group bacterium]